jgi:predicted phosphodiesterase
LVNPGNLAGMFYKATFAIYETKTDKLELKILETLR